MTAMYNAAVQLVEQGLLRATSLPEEESIELFCYTKQCFFGKNTWNRVTMTHRGQLYHHGLPVNKPFHKIFNVGEVEITNEDDIRRRMMNESYEVHDKANGHLFIASAFVDDDGRNRIVYSTKGSLPHEDNELLNADIEIFKSKFEDRFMDLVINHFPNSTWMFEAIVEHDKHSMYTSQVEAYGKDTFVLLGCNAHEPDMHTWLDMPHNSLTRLAKLVGFPVIKKHNHDLGDIGNWVDHTGIEGYVIRFNDGFRCKIKTTEYWMTRLTSDLTAHRFVQMYRSGGVQRMRLKLPEEIADRVIYAVLEHHYMWHIENLVDIDNLPDDVFRPRTEEDLGPYLKWLHTETDYTAPQRSYITSIAKRESCADRMFALSTSTEMRDRFHEAFEGDTFFKEDLQNDIEDIVVDLYNPGS